MSTTNVNIKAVTDWMFPVKEWNKRLQEEAEDFLAELYDDYGGKVLKMLYAQSDVDPELMESFDVTNPEIEKFLSEYSMKFAKVINDETESMLRGRLSEGIQEGESIADLTDRVQEVFKGMESWRAERIARTETIRATNRAADMSYKMSGVVSKKEWITAQDERLCEFCAAMDGTVVEVGENFLDEEDDFEGDDGGEMTVSYEDVNGPPLHPNCRCCLVPVIEEEKGFIEIIEKGGSGSGNFGHEGRPGEVGGSGEGGEVESRTDISSATTAPSPVDAGVSRNPTYRGQSFYAFKDEKAKKIIESDFEKAGVKISKGEVAKILSSARYYSGDNGYVAIRNAALGRENSFETPEDFSRAMVKHESLEKWLEHAPILPSGKKERVIYRGLKNKEKFFDGVAEGSYWNPKALSSWTTNSSVAKKFTGDVMLILKGSMFRGTSFCGFSKFPTEREVLVSGKNQFKIDKKYKVGSVLHVEMSPSGVVA